MEEEDNVQVWRCVWEFIKIHIPMTDNDESHLSIATFSQNF